MVGEKVRLAKYVNKSFGDSKYYYLSPTINGTYILKEFRNGVKATQLTMAAQDALNMKERLEANGWQEA
jgi:hypothetical protein